MSIALTTLGFTSTIAQVLLMRELVATFYGNELLFGLVLATWLAWVAAGAWISDFGSQIARLAPPSRKLPAFGKVPQSAMAVGLVGAAVLLLAEMALVRGVRLLLRVTPGAFVEFGPMVGAVVLILAPLCLLVGFLFTLGARLTVEQGGSAGRAYVWESIGAVTGGALFSFLLIRYLDPFQTALLVSAVNLAVASGKLQIANPQSAVRSPQSAVRNPQSAVRSPQSAIRNPHSPFSILHSPSSTLLLLPSCLLLLLSLPLGRSLHTATLRWQWPDLAFVADSPYGRLAVQARDGQRVFYENGLLAFETQGTFPEEVAHFSLLAHPDPREVLLVGGGVAGDLREILKHPGTRVTYVELDPLLIETAQAHLPPQDAAVLDDPRVTLVLTDGRLYVKTARRTFDAVILDLPEPATGALNRFYTREFFAEVRAVLNPGGLFALGLPSAENYWSPELARRNGSVYWTLRDVFPEVVVLPGEHNFFLASDVPLEADPALWAGRLAERGIKTRWVTPEYIEYVFTTLTGVLTRDRFTEVQSQLAATAGVRLNRDLAPICYYYDLALWLSRFYPNLREVFERASLVNLWWVAVPLLLAVGLVRWRRGRHPEAYEGWAVPFAIATAGLANMMLEVVILFAFQVLHGTVYSRVSLIVTALMAGLALGGAAGNRLLPPSVPPRRGDEEGVPPARGDEEGVPPTRGDEEEVPPTRGDEEGVPPARGERGSANPAHPCHRVFPYPWCSPLPTKGASRRVRRAFIGMLAGVAVYSGVLPLVLQLPVLVPAFVFPLLALVAGALTGAAFPLAVALTLPLPLPKREGGERLTPPPSRGGQGEGGACPVHLAPGEEQGVGDAHPTPPPPRGGQGEGGAGRAAGLLYGADLAGGCLGALLGAALFVPVLGIPQTCAAITLAALAGLTALL